MDFRRISPPDDQWLTRLRRDHWVWDVKGDAPLQVVWAWEPPEPGCISGRIGVRQAIQEDYSVRLGAIWSWYARPDGRGLDHSLILAPLEGNCPDEPAPISEVWQRHVERTLSRLLHRVEQLEERLSRAAAFIPGLWEDGP